MAIGGWWRLWIALSVAWIGFCAFLTFGSQGEVYSGSVVATAKGNLVIPADIQARYRRLCFGPTTKLSSEYHAAIPLPKPDPWDQFSDAVKWDNEQPKPEDDGIPKGVPFYNVAVNCVSRQDLSAAIWAALIPCLGLLTLGIALRWIVRGFAR